MDVERPDNIKYPGYFNCRSCCDTGIRGWTGEADRITNKITSKRIFCDCNRGKELKEMEDRWTYHKKS